MDKRIENRSGSDRKEGRRVEKDLNRKCFRYGEQEVAPGTIGACIALIVQMLPFFKQDVADRMFLVVVQEKAMCSLGKPGGHKQQYEQRTA